MKKPSAAQRTAWKGWAIRTKEGSLALCAGEPLIYRHKKWALGDMEEGQSVAQCEVKIIYLRRTREPTEEELRIARIHASAGSSYPGYQETCGKLARALLRCYAAPQDEAAEKGKP